MDLSEIETQFANLKTRLDTLPDVKQPPDTTLNILGQSTSEGAWHDMLEYFIDPTRPHGFDTDVLDRFLASISDHHAAFQYSQLDFDEVAVNSEVSLSEGRPDLIIHAGREWFLCIELKVRAQEGDDQTLRYVRDNSIGPTRKSEFPDEGQHYVYISPRSARPSDASEFVDVSWETLVETIESFLHQHRGVYPSRSEAQLDDYLAGIKRELNMTNDDYWTNTTEKARILMEHQAAIEETEEAFKQVVDEMQESWTETFLEDHMPEHWSDEWSCPQTIWGQLHHRDWRLDPDFQPVSDQEESAVTVQFVHFIRNEDLLKRGKLRMQLKWPKKQDPSVELRDEFRARLDTDEVRERLDPIRRRHGIELIDGTSSFTEKVYDVDPERFPESYYETLSRAFDEHYEMVPVISDVIDQVTKNAA